MNGVEKRESPLRRHAVVCIKQVPDSTDVRLDPQTNTLIREGVESVMNPMDEFALEQALRLKDSLGMRVSVVTMGPPQAAEVLRAALARGADEAFLVSSRAFGGADTLATAYTLAQAVKTIAKDGPPAALFFGKQASDGDTAQVGPGVSAFLGIPVIPYVRSLRASGDGAFSAETVWDDGLRTVEGVFPAVFTVTADGPAPRYASLSGTIRASTGDITVLDERSLGADPACLGLPGSPTKVVRISPPPKRTAACERLCWTGDAKPLAQAVLAATMRKGMR